MFIHNENGPNHRKVSNQKSQKSSSKHPPLSDFSMQDLLKGKHLEIVAAALLLSGKLKVTSVQLFRESPIVYVTLLGEYLSQEKEEEDGNALADLLAANGDMTIDDVFAALQTRMERGR